MKTLALLPFAILGFASQASNPTEGSGPKEILLQIAKMRQDLTKKVTDGQTVDVESEQAKIAQFIQAKVNGLDIKTLSDDDAYDWIPIFQEAHKPVETAQLVQKADRALSWKSFVVDAQIVDKMLADGKLADAQRKIRNMAFFAGPSIIGHFHLGVRRSLFNLAKNHPKEVGAIYDDLIARIHFDSPLTEDDKKWRIAAYGEVKASKYLALDNGGKKAEALKGLQALKTEITKAGKSDDGHGNNPLKAVTDAIAQVDGTVKTKPVEPSNPNVLVGQSAPEVTLDRTIGTFANLASLRGKVVILDFMAHWCGPCKAALPSLINLQSGNKSTIQVVSLTGYYGYYGTTKDLAPAKEFDLMKSFVTNYKMDWPVVFDASGKNNKNYHVGGIPQLVLIDKKGIVRKVEIGFEPVSFEATRQLAVKLSAE